MDAAAEATKPEENPLGPGGPAAPPLDALPAPPVAPDGYTPPCLPGEVVFARSEATLQDWVVASPERSGQLSGQSLSGEVYATSYSPAARGNLVRAS